MADLKYYLIQSTSSTMWFALIEKLLPKSAADTLSFLFLTLAIFITFIFEVTTVIPIVHIECFNAQIFHSIMGLYIMHVIIGNLYLLIKRDTSIRSLVLPSNRGPFGGWRFCSVCESNCPPRSFHCDVCNICILRRDHHCTFGGVCVGYKNTKYFMGLLFGLSIGTLYASILNQYFIWSQVFDSLTI